MLIQTDEQPIGLHGAGIMRQAQNFNDQLAGAHGWIAGHYFRSTRISGNACKNRLP